MNKQVLKDIFFQMEVNPKAIGEVVDRYPENTDTLDTDLLDDLDDNLLELLKNSGMLKQYIDMDISNELEDKENVG